MVNNFNRSLGKTEKAIEKALQKFKAYKHLAQQKAPVDPKNLENTIYELETATLEARKLFGYDVYLSQNEAYMMRMENISNVYRVKVEIKNDTVHIIMPNVVSKKSKTTYVRDSLNYALSSQLNEPLELENVVVSFIYHFAENVRTFDYDNIETRSILNVLTKFVIKDDSPKQMDMYQTAAFDGETYTEIYVEPKGTFWNRHFSAQLSQPP